MGAHFIDVSGTNRLALDLGKAVDAQFDAPPSVSLKGASDVIHLAERKRALANTTEPNVGEKLQQALPETKTKTATAKVQSVLVKHGLFAQNESAQKAAAVMEKVLQERLLREKMEAEMRRRKSPKS